MLEHKGSHRFAGKVAVVTGGSSGIGLAAARAFREEGARVAIMGRDEKKIAEAVAELGPDAFGFSGDVASVSDLSRFFEQVGKRFGAVDVLFANAGVVGQTPIETTEEAEFERIISTNVKGVFFTVQKALPMMPAGSSVVLCSSVVRQTATPGSSAYSSSKAAVMSMTRVLAQETVNRGIRVNAVSPGPTETPILDRDVGKEAADRTRRYLADQIPMKRLGTSQEIAEAVLFLASEQASFMTGQELVVDGGYTL